MFINPATLPQLADGLDTLEEIEKSSIRLVAQALVDLVYLEGVGHLTSHCYSGTGLCVNVQIRGGWWKTRFRGCLSPFHRVTSLP